MVQMQLGTIVGVGDPVMDILARVDHEFLATLTSEPGGCTQMAPAEMQECLRRSGEKSTLKRIPGGSAANVMKGLANISRRTLDCKFMGMVAKDSTGTEYRSELNDQGVHPILLESDSGAPTAMALCLVTPDGQRTMRTCLGASLELQHTSQLPNGWSNNLRLLHCEGYCLYRPQFTKELMAEAKRQGALVSIDLASFELVRNCKESFLELLRSGTLDLLFANEEEAATLAVEMQLRGEDAEHATKVSAAQDFLLQHIKVSVVSMGAKGCTARSHDGTSGSSPAPNVKVIDTIGAGDCFTAGFLFAYLNGCDLAKCCAVGCQAGGQAVQAEGAELSHDEWSTLQNNVDKIIAPPVADGKVDVVVTHAVVTA